MSNDAFQPPPAPTDDLNYRQYEDPVHQPRRGPGKGCFMVGCGCLALIGLGIAFMWMAAFTALRAYTVDERAIQVEQLSGDKLDAFLVNLNAWRGSEQATELRINAAEASALVAQELGETSVVMRFEFTPQAARVAFSVPLDAVPGFSERFLEGKVDFALEVQNGELFAKVLALEVKGKAVPAEFLTDINNDDLLEEAKKQDALKPFVSGLSSVELGDGYLVLKR